MVLGAHPGFLTKQSVAQKSSPPCSARILMNFMCLPHLLFFLFLRVVSRTYLSPMVPIKCQCYESFLVRGAPCFFSTPRMEPWGLIHPGLRLSSGTMGTPRARWLESCGHSLPSNVSDHLTIKKNQEGGFPFLAFEPQQIQSGNAT